MAKALKATKNAGLQPALDWLDKHGDDPMEPGVDDVVVSGHSLGSGAVGETEEGGSGAAAEEAKSLVCDDCGKQFRSSDLAQFHATKTGHANFSQSAAEVKPMTEEEKAAQLEKAKILLAEKREKDKQREIDQAKENERLR